MGSVKTDLVNGIISLVISVAVIALLADDEAEPYTLGDVLLAAGVSAFLSGYLTSYFAK
ncbi:hypothetical protein [Halorubrum vacuolatum]|uniref:Uncharacterized protein n=1 Tax=Halorubrum vacuolatum TaxID=63740 RepID=A0A238VNP0_HALVU|nr:hypothetical protein [Halorubrum vacuolatum]SNR35975.1 hypothetical protein SAMN06264855_103202 [Halorubrum vacuolatum]